MRTLKQDFIYGGVIIAFILLINEDLTIIPILFFTYLMSSSLFYMSLVYKEKAVAPLRKKSRRFNYLGVVIGISIVIWGLLSEKNDSSWMPFNGRIIVGGIVLLFSLLNSNKYKFILTKDKIIFTDNIFCSSWKIKDLDSIRIKDSELIFIKEPVSMKVELNTELNESLTVKEFIDQNLPINLQE